MQLWKRNRKSWIAEMVASFIELFSIFIYVSLMFTTTIVMKFVPLPGWLLHWKQRPFEWKTDSVFNGRLFNASSNLAEDVQFTRQNKNVFFINLGGITTLCDFRFFNLINSVLVGWKSGWEQLFDSSWTFSVLSIQPEKRRIGKEFKETVKAELEKCWLFLSSCFLFLFMGD